jgi:large subunit ribosomal protein L6
MSRIGNQPISIPSGVKATVSGQSVAVEGPKGKLERQFRPEVSVAVDDGSIVVTRSGDDRIAKSMHGLTRALIQNMVVGVADGYQKKLQIVGVGYLASLSGNELTLRVGFANEVKKIVPEGVTVTCPDQTHVLIQGCDKQKVGQFAAEVRAVRKPEPYKGKGIRYDGEYVKIKPGKTAT